MRMGREADGKPDETSEIQVLIRLYPPCRLSTVICNCSRSAGVLPGLIVAVLIDARHLQQARWNQWFVLSPGERLTCLLAFSQQQLHAADQTLS